ncbi:Uncharacterised protein [Mycobacteroides abscessus subsp. massiliense]|nr:Uncharacterised protein [Mycobacteroides abscessus subsp. massiliense]
MGERNTPTAQSIGYSRKSPARANSHVNAAAESTSADNGLPTPRETATGVATPAGTNVGPEATADPPPPDPADDGAAAGDIDAGTVAAPPPAAAGAPNPGDGNNIPPAPGAPIPGAGIAGPEDGTCCPEPAKPAGTADAPDTGEEPTPGVTAAVDGPANGGAGATGEEVIPAAALPAETARLKDAGSTPVPNPDAGNPEPLPGGVKPEACGIRPIPEVNADNGLDPDPNPLEPRPPDDNPVPPPGNPPRLLPLSGDEDGVARVVAAVLDGGRPGLASSGREPVSTGEPPSD